MSEIYWFGTTGFEESGAEVLCAPCSVCEQVFKEEELKICEKCGEEMCAPCDKGAECHADYDHVCLICWEAEE